MPSLPIVDRLTKIDAHALSERPSDGSTLFEIPGWANATPEGRIAFMREVIGEYMKDPALAGFVLNNIFRPQMIPPREFQRQAEAMLGWVQTNVYYMNEPDERLQTPWRTLKWRYGDCDDVTILLGAMAGSVGLSTRMVLAGAGRDGKLQRWVEGSGRPSRSVEWSHVYLEIGWPPFVPTYWASAEPTMSDAPLGYDVVLHGVAGDDTGRIRVPGPGEAPRGSMPELSRPSMGMVASAIPYGAPGGDIIETRPITNPFEDPQTGPGLFDRDFWSNAFMAAIEGLPAAIVSAVAIWYITKKLEKRR